MVSIINANKLFGFMLNARWLETFVAVCEDGNLTRTAERLHMTQPGVSQHLKKLEDQLGTALLKRTGKSFTLTPAGEKLREIGISRQREERQLLDALLDDDPDMGTVSIACSGSFASRLHPRLLSLAISRPDLVLCLEAAPQATILRGVSDGQLDLGILNEKADHPRISSEPIGQEEICLVLPANAGPDMPSFEELEARGFIAHPDGANLANLLFSPNYPEQFTGGDRLRIRGQVNQIGQILAPVAQGIGYSILPRSGLETFAECHKVLAIRTPTPVFQELWLVHRKGRQLASRTEAPIDIIKDIARALTACS